MIRSLIFAMGLTAGLTAIAGAVTANPEFWRYEWPNTDFETTSVENWVEILSGGPPKDGIPALTDPNFISAQAEDNIGDMEPVISVDLKGQTPRAYPLRYLTWHEIVNDVVGDVPIAVTFCPLCNSGITFDRRTKAGVLEFGVTGKLRHSDMIMYDRQTESWWQQATGLGIVGELTGVTLTRLPTWMESWASFKARDPQGAVMAEPSYGRNYGRNPYERYDSATRPFLYSGEVPPHDVPSLVRVVRVGDRAWPLTRLAKEREVTEAGVRITWEAGQASALDKASIADSKDVGSVRVYDATTGADLAHDVMFAFAFHAFWPKGTWMMGGS